MHMVGRFNLGSFRCDPWSRGRPSGRVSCEGDSETKRTTNLSGDFYATRKDVEDWFKVRSDGRMSMWDQEDWIDALEMDYSELIN
jgi:hypothetical protein